MLLLFGMMAAAKPTDPAELAELQKKAIYYKLKYKLESKQLTILEVQKIWKEELKKLKQQEAN